MGQVSRNILLGFMPLLLWACPMEERLIFYPVKTVDQTPRDVGLDFDDLYFTARDGVSLHGWFIPYSGAQNTILWFHGNAGNIGHRVQNLRLLHDKVKINIFIFDYRGYGRSGGEISEAGSYLDGNAAMDFLRQRYNVNPRQLVLFGRSLGAAVAAEMATRVDSMAVILESPFVSVREMARAAFPLVPLGLLLSTRYDNLEKVRRVRSPLLVLHGDRDEVVPFAQGRIVFEAARQPKRFYAIAGAGHNDTFIAGGDTYFAALREGLDWAASMQRNRHGDLEKKYRVETVGAWRTAPPMGLDRRTQRLLRQSEIQSSPPV
jgi:fermentation-respiration switch protein FrsA (DUF1100 family)